MTGPLLLDTHAFLWFVADDPALSVTARQALAAPGIELFFSHVSIWELAIKHARGKLELPESPEQFVQRHTALHRIRLLPIGLKSIYAAAALPAHHGDPFDRLLIAQCLRHGLPLVGRDATFDVYGVQRLW